MEVLCHEPEGAITHHVWPFSFTKEATVELWKQASRFPVLFGKRLESFEDFSNHFIIHNLSGDIEPLGLVWIIDDFKGMFYLDRITDTEASVHYAFFDRRHKGREVMVIEMLRMVFEKYKFTRLNVEIPAYAGMAPRKFVERCGFSIEGRKRNASYWKGKLFHVYCYGILPEDLDGRNN